MEESALEAGLDPGRRGGISVASGFPHGTVQAVSGCLEYVGSVVEASPGAPAAFAPVGDFVDIR